MSMTTPPGWYPDPGVPATERWWDGNAWTGHTQPLGTAAVPAPAAPQPYQQTPSYPPAYQQPYQQPQTVPLAPYGPYGGNQVGSGGGSGGGNRRRLVVVAATGIALVSAIVAGVTLLGDDEPAPPPRATEPAPGPTDDPDTASPSADPSEDPHVLVDQLNGITLPIPAEWEKSDSFVDRSVTMTTVGDYKCPGETGRYCTRGKVMSLTATQTDAGTPEALAKEDIEEAANAAYDEDSIGNALHGGIESHTVVKTGSTTVAGRTGYLVRWQVKTGKGPGGYVQSLVFPSTIGAESLIIVRFAFDAGPEGPPLSGMDTITKGIRAVGESTGGVGSSIGPS